MVKSIHEEEMSEPDDTNDLYIASLDMIIKPIWDGSKYIDKQTWNSAIEAAATMATRTSAEIVAENIRTLKK